MDLLDLSKIFFALLVVLGLIGTLALAARKIGFASGAISLTRKRRLALIESLALDARRRVAIIRCDGREHLILLGAASETVIDDNIPAAPVDESMADSPAPNFSEALHRLKKFPGANPFSKDRPADAA